MTLPEKIGEFEIVSKLGTGGMGVVYLARHSETKEQVALKMMHAELVKQDDLRRRFVREARATMALDHPNIIRIRASFTVGDTPVIAMEVLKGLSLKEYLAQEGKLGIEETAGIFTRVVSAVGAAHALGVVHRDLKPDNIFLLEESPFVKVLDFGIAKLAKSGTLAETRALTKTGMMVGTPFYMSPEQAFGEKSIDHRSDIWSLGMILTEVLTGTLPTRADRLEEVFDQLINGVFPRLDRTEPGFPTNFADLVEKMLQRDPANRPADLREVYETLSRHAPEVESMRFAAAVAPRTFDEPTTGSGSKKAITPPPQSAEPLKLAPQGTVVMTSTPVSTPKPVRSEPPPSGGTVIMSAETSRETPAAKRTDVVRESLPQPAPAKSTWAWWAAAVLVIACVAILYTQLR